MNKRVTTAVISGFVALGVSANSSAEELYNKDGKTLNLNAEAAFGWFSSGVNYGNPNKDTGDERISWTEGYVKLGFDGTWQVLDDTQLYGAVSALGSFTAGDGDPLGFTLGNESDLDLEDAVVGVRVSDIMGEGSSLDLSLGSQKYQVGDGWLIGGDSVNGGNGFGGYADRGGAYWLAARKAFRETAIAKIETGTGFGGDVFYLGSDNPYHGDTKLAGFDLRYSIDEIGAFGGTYARVVDVDADLWPNRDDLDIFSLRYQGSAGVEDLFLSAEGTIQDGDDVNEWAAYGEVGYTFSDVTWSPYVGYRYSHFSEGYDPLHYSFSRGYGTWYQGEVAGNYSGPFSSNTGIHNVQFYVHPREDVRLGALYFNFMEDTSGLENSFGDAQEIDFFAEWSVSENLFVSPLYGIHIPGDGFEDTWGTDDVNHYFQVIALAFF